VPLEATLYGRKFVGIVHDDYTVSHSVTSQHRCKPKEHANLNEIKYKALRKRLIVTSWKLAPNGP
jgi:hypothetical protein